jgi:hypothetical protein
VTESDWLTATDPQPLLDHLRSTDRLSDRKARLFAVACCRRIWHLLTHEWSQRAVEVAERYADGEASEGERGVAWSRAGEVATDFGRSARINDYSPSWLPEGWKPVAGPAEARRALPAAFAAKAALGGHHTVLPKAADWSADAAKMGGMPGDEREEQSRLLRDIFGPLPFRPVAVEDGWLAWNDGTVRRLAEAVYENRSLPGGTLDNARLAVLADALEEAGCGDAELLGHLRGPRPHVRGCWPLDLLLGKG